MIDLIFVSYFIIHIPIFLFFDSQAIMPNWIYPKPILELMDWYKGDFRDPLMADPPAWFQSFIVCEGVFQLPFFFVAAYAYWKGVSQCRWIRLPVIVYSSHLITVLFAILYHVNTQDFSQSAYPGPRTVWERMKLSAIYFPFFAVPFTLLVDAAYSSVYRDKHKQS